MTGIPLRSFLSTFIALAMTTLGATFATLLPAAAASPNQENQTEYLWYEAENMRGFATQSNGEPVLNPSWLNQPKAKTPGWGMNGPGVSAEWTQGGESEWSSAAASADESRATIFQDLEIPRDGDYRIWIRYADWAGKAENFTVRIRQGDREVFRHEFGAADLIDAHDEVSMYWGWAFTWDSAAGSLRKGPARLSIEIEKPTAARRHVDCVLVTNDLAYVPRGREKPDFAAMKYLRQWSANRAALKPLTVTETSRADRYEIPAAWQRPKIAGRDFLMPWNIAREFWPLYEKPEVERPLYPFHAEPIDAFIEKYKGARDVPLFSSKLVIPVIFIGDLPQYLKEGSPFLTYIRETKVPFGILINYGAAEFSAEDGPAAFKLLTGELKDQFIGWVSGESIGHVWSMAATDLKLAPTMSRKEMLEALRVFYTQALDKKWSSTFHTQTGPMWDKLIPAQSTSSTSFAHALTRWGVRLLGMETAAVQPMTSMRIAFTRGAARQSGAAFVYYHAPNFGDSATTFTKLQNFAGPDFFLHSRYGPTMGPSLSWYRKNYYLYYMSGASAIYLEQGFDQFFKPGPGENPLQLNPLGRITDEFMRFVDKHPERGTPYTPIAFLLDPAHGWEMTDYPQWPFGLSQLERSDRALRELFAVAYYPGSVVEGEPASADRQAFVSGIFGDIFDVLVASDTEKPNAVERTAGPAPVATGAVKKSSSPESQSPEDAYRGLVAGGHIEWSPTWAKRLKDYATRGGTVVLNPAQIKGLPTELLGVRLTGTTGEAHNAQCAAPNEELQDLHGQIFRYEQIELKGAEVLMSTTSGNPLVTINKVGKGSIIFCAVADLLGEDDRIATFAAHMLAHVFTDVTPLQVRGDVEYLVNRTSQGWIVTLFNNNGVLKPQQGLAQVDRSANVSVSVSLRGQGIASAQEWLSDRPVEVKQQAGASDAVSVNIPPGGVAIVELRPR
ncbi:MAG: hypothetical protein QOE77_1133 [Blastocatellia bacterium]|jgi:hypothetical protein|nr:hypothetical protein [Blastocatellia bacterium]